MKTGRKISGGRFEASVSSRHLKVLDQQNENYNRRGYGSSNDEQCDQQEQPIAAGLPVRSGQVVSKQLVVPPVCLERNVEEIADEGHGPRQSFNPDVHYHPCNCYSWDAKLDRSGYDVQGNQGIDHISNSGD